MTDHQTNQTTNHPTNRPTNNQTDMSMIVNREVTFPLSLVLYFIVYQLRIFIDYFHGEYGVGRFPIFNWFLNQHAYRSSEHLFPLQVICDELEIYTYIWWRKLGWISTILLLSIPASWNKLLRDENTADRDSFNILTNQ